MVTPILPQSSLAFSTSRLHSDSDSPNIDKLSKIKAAKLGGDTISLSPAARGVLSAAGKDSPFGTVATAGEPVTATLIGTRAVAGPSVTAVPLSATATPGDAVTATNIPNPADALSSSVGTTNSNLAKAFSAIFNALDTEGDGLVTQADIDTLFADFEKSFAEDGIEGKHLQALKDRISDLFSRADQGSDGVSRKEFVSLFTSEGGDFNFFDVSALLRTYSAVA